MAATARVPLRPAASCCLESLRSASARHSRHAFGTTTSTPHPPRAVRPSVHRQLLLDQHHQRRYHHVQVPAYTAATATKAITTANPSRRWHSTSTSSSSSVNPDEVSHFNALASEWWDPYGSSRLLHLMNPLRHDFINSCLDSQAEPRPTNLSFLDIGCGGGIFAESAARLSTTRHVTAIDPTPSVLAVAKAHARKDPALAAKLTYRQTAIEGLELPPEGEGYDVVSVFEVLEHVDDPGAFLAKVRPFVKPGGWLVASTIARTWMSWLTTNLIAEDLLRIVPKGTHDWNKYINHNELQRYFLDKGWNSPRVMGVVYVPGLGWKEVRGSEQVGNYFIAVRRDDS